ncbi:MAG: lipoprotein insertase outer membrane protein LolB [Gammaproteobacteria bacterium]
MRLEKYINSRYCTTALLLTVLAGCAGRPVKQLAVDNARWQMRQSQLSAIHHWTASGRIAIRDEVTGWTASYEWQQSPDSYDIQLRGPLGYGVMQLIGSDQRVELRQAGKTALYSASAEQLLVEQTGWQLPVEGLRYWILGLPRPDSDEQHQLNDEAALDTLHQDGWKISYSRYKEVKNHWLPGKITLTQADLSVKLLVDAWKLE